MENKNELKESDIKKCACYCFDGIIEDIDINFSNILLDKNLFENILVYDISYKPSTGPKPLRIRFDKIDGFIRVRGSEFTYLVLFDYGLFDKICDGIKYLISEKCSIGDSIIYFFGRIRIDSSNYLPIEETLNFHNIITLIKSVVNKNKKNYYYNIFLEKVSYKDKSNTQYL